jgi:hypothetical protein
VRRWLLIGGGVLIVHLLLFAVVANWKVLPKKKYVPAANFGAAEATYTEPDTGEKVTVKEFTVTTELAPSPTASPGTSPAASPAPEAEASGEPAQPLP